tara:strand:- start:6 stop:770 length:765 start_codon:yes stop_codon:yes gene_type:complete
MTNTPLDTIITKVLANDIVENRLTLFRRFLETELFILIDNPDNPKPELMQIDGEIISLAFDCEEKLIDFAGEKTFFISMSGRRLIAQNDSTGIALNLNNMGGGYILTNDVIEWLMKNTQSQKEIVQRNTNEIASPSIVTERFVELLDEALAASFGLADYAVLVKDLTKPGSKNLLLIFVGSVKLYHDALAQQASEAFSLSGIQDIILDITFCKSEDELVAKALLVGLRFDLPQIEKPSEPKAPGMDPTKPPLLR